MDKVIFLGSGAGSGYSPKTAKRLFLVTGALFLINGTFLIYNNVVYSIGLVIGVLTLLGGFY